MPHEHSSNSVNIKDVNELIIMYCDFVEAKEWFDDSTRWGCPSIIPLNEINAKDSGFLVNGELKIVAEIDILEVIGDVDVSEGISTVKETIDVNGFQLLPSQVKKN